MFSLKKFRILQVQIFISLVLCFHITFHNCEYKNTFIPILVYLNGNNYMHIS